MTQGKPGRSDDNWWQEQVTLPYAVARGQRDLDELERIHRRAARKVREKPRLGWRCATLRIKQCICIEKGDFRAALRVQRKLADLYEHGFDGPLWQLSALALLREAVEALPNGSECVTEFIRYFGDDICSIRSGAFWTILGDVFAALGKQQPNKWVTPASKSAT